MQSNAATKKIPRIGLRDVVDILRILILTVVAWTVPERHWASFARAAASLHARILARRLRVRRQHCEQLFGDRLGPAALDRLIKDNLAHGYTARLQGLREYWPAAWRPAIEVVGANHIENALARGHGVVLWVTPFAYSHLMTKRGLHAAGVQVTHLSRPGHGFSRSPFAKRFLNPIWTHIEDRHLMERVRISAPNDTRSALAILRERLRMNRVVSITVGSFARKTVEAAFFSGTLRLATGPLHLARTMDAVLLPVFSVRLDTGQIVVNVEGPLLGQREGQDDEPYESVIRRYVKRLESYVLRFPSQSYGALGL
jgi:lauroyl/myristoyl acyltransferase